MLRLLPFLYLPSVEACCCNPSDMTGVWSGIHITFEPAADWNCSNQRGKLIAKSDGAKYDNFAALGDGVGEWSGGYDYFHADMNFSGNPGKPYTGQLDCSCSWLSLRGGGSTSAPRKLSLQANTTRPALNWTEPALQAPSWSRNLTIIEVNPRAFTTTAGVGDNSSCRVNPSGSQTHGGCGTGTWASFTAEGVPYLSKLGVTGVWIAGSALATSHFFGIWSSYATVDPSILDPALGPEQDFAELVAALHDAGIKVFLDVTTHGVVNESPLIEERPEYFFKGGKWQMTDFNYASTKFLDWWVDVWVNYTVKYGVDGYRLDGPNGLSYSTDVLAVWDRITARAKDAGHPITVFGEVTRYHFGEHDETSPGGDMSKSKQDLGKDFDKRRGKPDSQWCGSGRSYYESIMFSCHDSGFSQKVANYLKLRGSRAAFGYLGVFSWKIPVWMAGEEFNNEPLQLPATSVRCYYSGECCAPGQKATGGWSYGTQFPSPLTLIQKNATQSDMLTDISKMLAIASAHADLVHRDSCSAQLTSIDNFTADGTNAEVWVPYVRWLPGKALVVAANSDTTADLHLTLSIPLDVIGMTATDFVLQDLWAGSQRDVSRAELQSLKVSVAADGGRGGGFAALLLTAKGASPEPIAV